uniref:Uncharacterized protein n=1 Tax=Megaselia scalaris TaxID=36166 RepID=T1GGA9_MEGSC
MVDMVEIFGSKKVQTVSLISISAIVYGLRFSIKMELNCQSKWEILVADMCVNNGNKQPQLSEAPTYITQNLSLELPKSKL